MAIPKQTPEQIEATMDMLGLKALMPEFCSLDEVVDHPAEWGDPFYAIVQKEKVEGIPIAFQRDIDFHIRHERRMKELDEGEEG